MIFRKTLAILTVQYSALLLILFAVFSTGIYMYMEHTFGGDYAQRLSSETSNPPSHEKIQTATEISDIALDRLRNGLIINYGGLLVLIPAVSYLLARRALRPVEMSYEAQQRFVDDASHELRTPLSIIQGELELALSRSRSPREYKKAISKSLGAASSLTRLVSNLLMLARGSDARLYQSFEQINLAVLTKRAIKTLKLSSDKTGPRITNNIQGTLAVSGSSELIERALVNVIENANKFTPASGQIVIDALSHEQSIEISIRDTGQGMTKRQLERAFDRFWRADTARTVKGHGLGLSLVRQIMAIHHGSISIKSEPGEGTTVILVFPKNSLSR